MADKILRTCKDKDNPYVMLNKEFLNNDNLSWKAKGLLAYLLSLPDDWKIYLNELKNHSSNGRDSTASALKELIDNNYIIKTTIRKNGKFSGYEYIVYEKQQNSNNIHKTENGFSVSVKSENEKSENVKPDTTNNNITNNNITNKENNTSENNSDENEKPIEEEKKVFDKESAEYKMATYKMATYKMATYLYKKLQKLNPNHKKPDFQKWAKEADYLIRLDKRHNLYEIKDIIDWAFENTFWKSKVLSISGLRKNYDTIFIQMNNDKNKNNTVVNMNDRKSNNTAKEDARDNYIKENSRKFLEQYRNKASK